MEFPSLDMGTECLTDYWMITREFERDSARDSGRQRRAWGVSPRIKRQKSTEPVITGDSDIASAVTLIMELKRVSKVLATSHLNDIVQPALRLAA